MIRLLPDALPLRGLPSAYSAANATIDARNLALGAGMFLNRAGLLAFSPSLARTNGQGYVFNNASFSTGFDHPG